MKHLFCFLAYILVMKIVFAQDNTESRATWIITWEHISSGTTAEQNQARVRQIIENHKKANMNALFWQARQSGTAYYRSNYEPWGYYAGYQDPGYDHLAYAVEEAHSRGMEIHAWFNVFAASSTYEGAPAQVHPEWICRDQSGIPMSSSITLSPGLESVRAYTINVAMEIVRNYDIDGLHLDYIRWNEYTNSKVSKQEAAETEAAQPAFDGMISAAQLEDMQINKAGRYLYDVEHPYSGGVPAGYSSWEEWWRWSVTEFVRVLHDSIQAVKPWVKLSVAALGRYNWGSWQGYGSVYQDAALWFNQGYIEQLAPMHYHWTTGDDFYNMLAGGSSESWQPWIQQGIAEQRVFTVGPPSYSLSQNSIWDRHPGIVQKCRTIPWVDGFQFFSYGDWAEYNYWEEAKNTFFLQKTKVRPAGPANYPTPAAPAISLQKIDSLKYQITVTPDAGASDDHWFTLYRSTDLNLDLNTDEIIDIHFGHTQYSYQDTFNGRQDYNGTYIYFAAMLNRFWIESTGSNSLHGDSIPSFAPIVLSNDPQEGDTVSTTRDLILHFSKTMNTALLQANLLLNPPVPIHSIAWSADHKSATVYFNDNFLYSTDYTLTINANLTDINGVKLDGNGDGTGGDAFVIHFRTKAVDMEGPRIAYTNMSLEGPLIDFDIDGIINFGFNELLQKTSVTPASVYITSADQTIESKAKVFTTNNKSVLSIQSKTKLNVNANYNVMITDLVADTLGNPLDSITIFSFSTSSLGYQETKMLCDFVSITGIWADPEYSGSTIGTIGSNTIFAVDTAFYPPAFPTPAHKKSGCIQYEWNPDSSHFLLREYLSGGMTRDIIFDTTYIMQCYVYGDGSGNKFRFALDDKFVSEPALSENHEVSPWYTIDWYGWRLINWDLDKDPCGSWLGNDKLEGTLRFDSFQLMHSSGNAVKGVVYLKNLRLVKRQNLDPAGIANQLIEIPGEYYLAPNYPNPFNPLTHIDFTLPKNEWVSLRIYDMLGRRVMELVNEKLAPGKYQRVFNASSLSSGTYIYILQTGNFRQARKMVVLK